MDIGTGIALLGIWIYASVCSHNSFKVDRTPDTISMTVAIVFTIGMIVISNLHIGG